MEILWLIGIVFVVAIIWGGIAGARKTKAEDKQAAEYSDAIETERQKMIAGEGQASLPVLDPASEGYRPVGKENLLAVQEDATRMEMKSTGRYRTGGASVSIPIVKGVRYRVGSGTIRGEKTWQATDNGRLLVTDKAVVFEGGAKNERITWTQVANIELLRDGFSIFKRSGPPRTYAVASPNPKFAAVIELMLSRTE